LEFYQVNFFSINAHYRHPEYEYIFIKVLA